jgi:hypothetical protein
MEVKRFLISGVQLDNNISTGLSFRSIDIFRASGVRGGECSLAVVLVNDVDTGWGDGAILASIRLTK